ncbi:MAG: ABC transporter ATP-binding protein [Thermoproteales archaeon]|nr:ABC transporter ATP-binding protein [Thermoproteales archaeon]
MIVARFRDFSFQYEGTSFWALKDISLDIREGEMILITGPSGCGKSTFCRALNGLIPHFYEGVYKGSVKILGKEVKDTPTYELARYVGMVFQNPENQLFASTVEREIIFGLENLNLPQNEIKERLNEALRLLGIEDLRKRAPFELSGGQQQKVAIASIIAMRPRILVMDEPTANLDPVSALEVFDLLIELRKKLNITILVVEHRLEVIAPLVDRIIVMNKGRIIADGEPRDALSRIDVFTIGVGIPKVIVLYRKLKRQGIKLDKIPLTPDELAVEVAKRCRKTRST